MGKVSSDSNYSVNSTSDSNYSVNSAELEAENASYHSKAFVALLEDKSNSTKDTSPESRQQLEARLQRSAWHKNMKAPVKPAPATKKADKPVGFEALAAKASPDKPAKATVVKKHSMSLAMARRVLAEHRAALHKAVEVEPSRQYPSFDPEFVSRHSAKHASQRSRQKAVPIISPHTSFASKSKVVVNKKPQKEKKKEGGEEEEEEVEEKEGKPPSSRGSKKGAHAKSKLPGKKGEVKKKKDGKEENSEEDEEGEEEEEEEE